MHLFHDKSGRKKGTQSPISCDPTQDIIPWYFRKALESHTQDDPIFFSCFVHAMLYLPPGPETEQAQSSLLQHLANMINHGYEVARFELVDNYVLLLKARIKNNKDHMDDYQALINKVTYLQSLPLDENEIQPGSADYLMLLLDVADSMFTSGRNIDDERFTTLIKHIANFTEKLNPRETNEALADNVVRFLIRLASQTITAEKYISTFNSMLAFVKRSRNAHLIAILLRTIPNACRNQCLALMHEKDTRHLIILYLDVHSKHDDHSNATQDLQKQIAKTLNQNALYEKIPAQLEKFRSLIQQHAANFPELRDKVLDFIIPMIGLLKNDEYMYSYSSIIKHMSTEDPAFYLLQLVTICCQSEATITAELKRFLEQKSSRLQIFWVGYLVKHLVSSPNTTILQNDGLVKLMLEVLMKLIQVEPWQSDEVCAAYLNLFFKINKDKNTAQLLESADIMLEKLLSAYHQNKEESLINSLVFIRMSRTFLMQLAKKAPLPQLLKYIAQIRNCINETTNGVVQCSDILSELSLLEAIAVNDPRKVAAKFSGKQLSVDFVEIMLRNGRAVDWQLFNNADAAEWQRLWLKLISAGANTTPTLTAGSTFSDKYHEADKRAHDPAQHGRNYQLFMLKHLQLITKLYQIMNISAFSFMQKYLSKSVLNLERFVQCIDNIHPDFVSVLKSLFEKHKKAINTASTPDVWQQVLVTLPIFISVGEAASLNHNELVVIYQQVCEETTKLEDFNKIVIDKLLDNFLKYLGVPADDATKKRVLERLPLEMFAKLMSARHRMDGTYYQAIFDQLLLIDLQGDSIGSSFDHFLHDQEQTSEVGVKLAQHNAGVKKQLKEAGINTDLAYRYQKSFTITYSEKSSLPTDFDTLYRAIWDDLKALAPIVESILKSMSEQKDESSEITNLLKELLVEVQQLQKQLVPGVAQLPQGQAIDKAILQKMKDTNNLMQMQKINDQLAKLTKTKYSTLSDSFIEFRDHYRDHHQLLKNALKPKSKTDVPLKDKRFTVRQWSKDQLETYLLGDRVGCCLATNGGQFPALIQRRMDDAMFFHVVIDEDTQKPVALAWNYLAVDKNNPKDVYVVANFLEIANQYGMKSEVRDVLVDSLLYFSGKLFAKDIGAKGFLINQLSYGLIPNFDNFDQQQISVDKVGGFLKLDPNGPAGAENYYLKSLEQTQFHRFSAEKLKLNPAQHMIQTSSETATAVASPSITTLKGVLSATESKSEFMQPVEEKVDPDRFHKGR